MKQINNRTKIIATIGPSSSEYDTLKEMIKSGEISGGMIPKINNAINIADKVKGTVIIMLGCVAWFGVICFLMYT